METRLNYYATKEQATKILIKTGTEWKQDNHLLSLNGRRENKQKLVVSWAVNNSYKDSCHLFATWNDDQRRKGDSSEIVGRWPSEKKTTRMYQTLKFLHHWKILLGPRNENWLHNLCLNFGNTYQSMCEIINLQTLS